MIRNIIILAFVLFSVSAEAQYNRRQRVLESAPSQAKAQNFPEFRPEKAVGISIYDLEKLTKKIRLKKSSDNYSKVITLFNDFHKEIKQIKRINNFTFLQAKEKITIAQKSTLESRDFSELQAAYKDVSKTFEPIVKVVEEKEKKLDTELEKLLSEKQLKKWLTYKKKIKRKGK
jgi:hypothetical protein